jgi:hypothetical protein
MLMGTELYSLYLSGHLSEEEADEYLAILEGEEPANGRVDNSVYNTFINSLKSVRNTLGSLFVTPVYAKKANPLNWCWGCIFNSGWTPNGKVQLKYNNNSTGIVTRPVKGLKVVMHRGLKSIVAYTDNNGNFSSYRKFASRVTYTTHFRNRSSSTFGARYFRILKGYFWLTHKHDMQSSTRNDNITYTYDLSNNSNKIENMNEFAAAVYTAAYEFYHGNNLGFNRPRKNMRMRIYDGDGRGHHAGLYFLTTNQIKMYRKNSSGDRTAERVIGTTLHELGHASHYALDGCCVWNNAFHKSGNNNEDKVLKESWALYIDHQLGRTWFPNRSSNSAQNLTFTTMNKGFSSGGSEGKYTSLFFDLADTHDQSSNGSLADLPRDRVSGYTSAQMQNALRGASSLQDLRNNLFNYYNNGTEQHLQELIDSYSGNLKPKS